jgi:Fic family protein
MELTKQELEFLKENNAIESEYSKKALEDAKHAWNFAKKHKHNKIDINFIKVIHHELMRRLNPRIAGNIRKVPVYVGGECRSQSKKDIIANLKIWLETYFQHKTEKGIKNSHIFFEKTHPFEDGNGRTGRILMNIQRLNANLPILIIHEGEEQLDYYKWFKEKK